MCDSWNCYKFFFQLSEEYGGIKRAGVYYVCNRCRVSTDIRGGCSSTARHFTFNQQEIMIWDHEDVFSWFSACFSDL